jgi:hypothetical protein
LFNYFFREIIPEKAVFKFLTNLPILTIKFLLSYITCHDSFNPLFQTLGIWIQSSGAARHVSPVTYFSNLLEDKDKRLKTKLTVSLILRVNLRLEATSYGVRV